MLLGVSIMGGGGVYHPRAPGHLSPRPQLHYSSEPLLFPASTFTHINFIFPPPFKTLSLPFARAETSPIIYRSSSSRFNQTEANSVIFFFIVLNSWKHVGSHLAFEKTHLHTCLFSCLVRPSSELYQEHAPVILVIKDS